MGCCIKIDYARIGSILRFKLNSRQIGTGSDHTAPCSDIIRLHIHIGTLQGPAIVIAAAYGIHKRILSDTHKLSIIMVCIGRSLLQIGRSAQTQYARIQYTDNTAAFELLSVAAGTCFNRYRTDIQHTAVAACMTDNTAKSIGSVKTGR